MKRHHLIAVAVLALTACRKDADPKYVAALTERRDALCKCSSAPQGYADCERAAEAAHPAPSVPGNVDAAAYRDSVKDAAGASLKKLEQSTADCQSALTAAIAKEAEAEKAKAEAAKKAEADAAAAKAQAAAAPAPAAKTKGKPPKKKKK
jgi:colicin import membrane protein